MIYFVQAPSRLIKIGYSDKVGDRLTALRHVVSPRLTLLAVHAGGYRDETYLHEQFAHLRELSEWFWPGRDLLDYIAEAGTPWVKPARPRHRLVPDPTREKPTVHAWSNEDAATEDPDQPWRFHVEWEGKRFDFPAERHRSATRRSAIARGVWYARRMAAGQPYHKWPDIVTSAIVPRPATLRPMTSHKLARKLLAQPSRVLGFDPRTVFPEYFSQEGER